MSLRSALERQTGADDAFLHRGMLRWSLPFLAAILPIALLSVLSERMATRAVEELLRSQQLSVTSSVAQNITQTFVDRTTLVGAVASLPGTRTALQNNDRFALQTRLKAVVVAEPSVERAVALSSTGVVLAAFPSSSGSLKKPYASLPWVVSMNSVSGPDVTAAYAHPQTGVRTVAAIAPMTDGSGALVGMLVFETKAASLEAAFRSVDVPPGSTVMIVDADGRLLVHSATGALAGGESFVDVTQSSGVRLTEEWIDPLTNAAAVRTLLPVAVGKRMWTVIASQDKAVAMRDLQRLRFGLVAAGGVLTLLTLALISGLARTQAKNVRLNSALEGKNQELREVAAIVAASFDPIIGLTLDGTVRTWNPAAERLYGYGEAEMVGKPLWSLAPQDRVDALQAAIRDVAAGKPVTDQESVRVRKNGEPLPVSLTLSAILGPDGKPAMLSAIERDLTAQKQIEQMKDDFISFVSHQLKAPITATRWTIEGMLDGDYGPVPDAMKEPLNQMHDVTTKNFALISDILNASRIDRGVIELQRKKVELREIAERAMRDYRIAATKAGLTLTLEGGEQSIIVDADLEKVAEAVTNAISNAIKHTKSGGITLKLSRTSDRGLIDVVDTGEGMPPEMLTKLFSRTGVKGANTQAASSSGLGLYIAKHFMELHGGDISVTSDVGKGSIFRYALPLAGAPQGE